MAFRLENEDTDDGRVVNLLSYPRFFRLRQSRVFQGSVLVTLFCEANEMKLQGLPGMIMEIAQSG